MDEPIYKILEDKFNRTFLKEDGYEIHIEDYKNSYQILIYKLIETGNNKFKLSRKGADKLNYDIEFTEIKAGILKKMKAVTNERCQLINYTFSDYKTKINTTSGKMNFRAHFIIRKNDPEYVFKYLKKMNEQ